MPYRRNKWRRVKSIILILLGLFWRTALGLAFFICYASVGYVYSWPFYLPIAIFLGFAPWGWKVRAMLREEREEREVRKIEEKMRNGEFVYFSTKMEFKFYSGGYTFFKSILDDIFIAGFLGIFLGWKAIWKDIEQLIYDIQNLLE